MKCFEINGGLNKMDAEGEIRTVVDEALLKDERGCRDIVDRAVNRIVTEWRGKK